jgi:hypothetical protein
MRPKMPHELDQVADVVVQVELAARQRDLAGVEPVRDVDVMFGQQRLDRAAQQRGVVPRHRRHQKHRRMDLVGRALEVDQVAERLADHGHFPDRHLHAIDLRRG